MVDFSHFEERKRPLFSEGVLTFNPLRGLCDKWKVISLAESEQNQCGERGRDDDSGQ